MTERLRSRIERAERAMRTGEVAFELRDGSTAGLPGRSMADALFEGIENAGTRRAHVMRTAIRASDGSRMHELCQALAFGPLIPVSTSPETDVTPKEETIQ